MSLTIDEMGGIGEPYNLALEQEAYERVVWLCTIPLSYTTLGGKHVGEEVFTWRIRGSGSK